VEPLLCRLREFLVPRWIAWGSENNTVVTERGEGMCRFTAAFLSLALGRGWCLSGGYPDLYRPETGWGDNPNGGGFLVEGKWEAHHWVTNGRLIVDLTASQFGELPVLVVPVTDSRFRETLIFPSQRSEALRDVRKRAIGWHNEWKEEPGHGQLNPIGSDHAKRRSTVAFGM